MIGFDWQEAEVWRGHRVRRWDAFTAALGMLALGTFGAVAAMAVAPTADQTVWYSLGLVGLFAGNSVGDKVAAWHVRAQASALEAFEADFPTQEALHTAGATARRALRQATLPNGDATLLVVWASDGAHHRLTDVHVYTRSDDSSVVALDACAEGRGAGESPLLPATHKGRLWGANAHASRSFKADLPLGTAHQRLAFAAWLAATADGDAAILGGPPMPIPLVPGDSPGPALLRL